MNTCRGEKKEDRKENNKEIISKVMRLLIDKRTERETTILDEVTKIEIWVTNDKCFRLEFNQFNELVVNKQTYNEESSTIIIKPSVSNQINLL